MDSLDLSRLEPRCAEMISRCRSQDKHRYRIAFEKSWHDAMNSSNLNEMVASVCSNLDKRKNAPNSSPNSPCTSTREHPLCRSYQLASSSTSLSRLACLMNRSAHSDFTFRSHSNDMSTTITPNGPFLPLYNLAASGATTVSSSGNDSLTSAPTSLIKMFIQNRISPSSSGGLLSSYDDSPLDSSLGNVIAPSQANDGACLTDERKCAALELAKARQMQSSPITEEEDEDRSDREVQRKQSGRRASHHQFVANDESRQERQKRNIDFGLQQQNRSSCRRSVSMEEFGNRTSGNGIGRQLPARSALGNQTTSGLSSAANASKGAHSSARKMHSRECSVSSGYLSGGTGNTAAAFSLCDWNRKAQMTRTQTGFTLKASDNTKEAAVQTPLRRQDKQVQTSMDGNFTTSQPETPNESTPEKSPIYVYYPNYSLPDLQFVQKLAPMSMELLPDLRLSPTRIQTAVQNTSTDQHRSRFGKRPKSCGEFEQLNKDQFKHIQDWESLTTLLPKELQRLIKNLKLDVSDDLNSKKSTSQGQTDRTTNSTSNPLQTLNRLQSLQRVRKVNSLDSNLCATAHGDHSNTPFNCCSGHNHAHQTHFVPTCAHSNHSTSCRTSACVRDSQCTLRQSANRVCAHSTCNDSTQCANRSTGSNHSGSFGCPSRPRGLVKSATMNMPPRCACNAALSSCLNGSACQLYSNQCCSSSGHSHCGARAACSTPATPCDPIREQAEEFESVDAWFEQQNETDFDTFLRQLDHQPKIVKPRPVVRPQKSAPNQSRTKGKADKQTSPELNVREKSSFSAIRSRWESMGKPASITNRSKTVVQAKIDTGMRTTVRRRARSKSPPKSNKEVVIVTKKDTSTLKGRRAESTVDKTTTRQSQTTVTSGLAKRPNSFHSQFKSLIPVPRNAIKSPTNDKM
jgi:hypothetical protein